MPIIPPGPCHECGNLAVDNEEESSADGLPQSYRSISGYQPARTNHRHKTWASRHHYCRGRLFRTARRSEEHTSELQSLMRISYAVFCLKKKKTNKLHTQINFIKQH